MNASLLDSISYRDASSIPGVTADELGHVSEIALSPKRAGETADTSGHVEWRRFGKGRDVRVSHERSNGLERERCVDRRSTRGLRGPLPDSFAATMVALRRLELQNNRQSRPRRLFARDANACWRDTE